jgi:hypothetical protein
MTTRRYALDMYRNKIFIGSAVRYRNRIFLIEEIEYLSWSTNQYLTLVEKKNKNKKMKFIAPNEVRVVSTL